MTEPAPDLDVTPPPAVPPRPVPGYLGAPGQEMFCWFHPPSPNAWRRAGVVICPPLGYDAIPSHRTLRHLAERLAAAGLAAMRIDYPGTGDSASTDREPRRVDAWIEGIVHGIREMKRRMPGCPVLLVGLRLGATLAAAAATREAVAGVVLWAAAAKGRRYVREQQALSLAGDGAGGPASQAPGLEAAGYVITEETADDLRAIDLGALSYPPGLEVLVVDRDDLPADRRLVESLASVGVHAGYHRPPGFAQMMTDPHYTEVPGEALETIVEWLEARASGRGAQAAPAPMPVSRLELAADGVVEEPIRFGPDQRLFGILTRPAEVAEARHPTVLLLNAGSVSRVGPNRMYVEWARRWAALGHACLRFDFGGIGDSVQAAGSRENDPYSPHANDDIRAALDELRTRGAGDHFVLTGLCSGAYSAFSSGQRVDGVVRSILINPLTFYWREGMTLDTPTYRHFLAVRLYRQSVRTWSSWKRLLTGQVDLKPLLRIASERARRLLRSRWQAVRHLIGLDRHDAYSLRRDLRRLVDRGTVVSFVFSEGDPGYDLLMMEAGGLVHRLRREGRLSLNVVPAADHTFTPFAPRQRLGELLTDLVSDSGSGAA